MISIIICSRSKTADPALRLNIAETIGVEHEVIVIDNSENRYSIFEAYNLGVKQSRYPYLCFMHDDIKYHTTGWGLIVVEHFKDETTGAIGTSGSSYAAAVPGSWWAGGLVNETLVPRDAEDAAPLIKSFPERTSTRNEVVVLDGVWMCIRKGLFNSIRFDETTFKGFHFYDIDISLQIHRLGYKLYSVFDVLIQHFSGGATNKNWIDNALLIQKKWKRQLPASCIKLTHAQVCKATFRTLNEFLDIMLKNGMPKKAVSRIIAKEFMLFTKGYFYYQSPFYIYTFFIKLAKANSRGSEQPE